MPLLFLAGQSAKAADPAWKNEFYLSWKAGWFPALFWRNIYEKIVCLFKGL